MPDRRARERGRLVAAAALLTRLPLPRVEIEPDWLPRCAKYLPAVGALVGLLAAAMLLAAGALWARPVPEILALLAGLLVTGALHEDGLADSFDALGGTTRESRLAIMKDSRLGTFGVLAVLAALALQVAALSGLHLLSGAAALVAAHAGGRLMA
ncbi:adenosylcobinamide-GDP ribazoletransferase, partial [Enterovirga sp.]|uniref:adenosylcobinamide-GDP ribazoletransferase n=1 Tax=Enterovirga sp. TaxID=2026350 RepID=UPI00260E8D75